MPELIKKRKNSLAQSLIEYTMIIALVAGAIIAMHRYVFRGVFAGIKGWEEQVNDSTGEQFVLDYTPITGSGPGYTYAGDFSLMHPNAYPPDTSFFIQLGEGINLAIVVFNQAGQRVNGVDIANFGGQLFFSSSYWSGGPLFSGQTYDLYCQGSPCLRITFTAPPSLASGIYTFKFYIRSKLKNTVDTGL